MIVIPDNKISRIFINKKNLPIEIPSPVFNKMRSLILDFLNSFKSRREIIYFLLLFIPSVIFIVSFSLLIFLILIVCVFFIFSRRKDIKIPINYRKSKSLTLLFLIVIVSFGAFLRFKPVNVLLDNEVRYFTETAKIYNDMRPEEYTFDWAPNLVSTWHGYMPITTRIFIFSLFPYSIDAQFALTAFFGTLVIISTFNLGRKLFGDRVALLAAFLVAAMPMMVSSSMGLLMEVPMTFFLLETFNFLYTGIVRSSKKHVLVSAIFYGCALLSKSISILFLPSIALFILYSMKKKGFVKILEYCVIFSISLLMFSTWLIPNWDRVFSSSEWSFSGFVLNPGPASMWVDPIGEYIFELSPIGMYLLCIGIVYSLLKPNKEEVLCFLAVIPFIIAFRFFFYTSVRHHHIPLIPFFLIIISRPLKKHKNLLLATPFIIFIIYLFSITNVHNFIFDQVSESGYFLIKFPGIEKGIPETSIDKIFDYNSYDYNYFVLTLAAIDQGILDAIKTVDGLCDKCKLYVDVTLKNYEGFFVGKDVEIVQLPLYYYYNMSGHYLTENWLNQTLSTIKDTAGIDTYIVVSDFAYYSRVYTSSFFIELHQCEELQKEFELIYENHFLDQDSLDDFFRLYGFVSTPHQHTCVLSGGSN
jgi:hypothetical protein